VDAGCNWTGLVNTLQVAAIYDQTIQVWQDSFLQVHLQQCKSRLEICPNGCSEKIANSQVDKHISEECPYRKVVCEHCNRQITFIRKEVFNVQMWMLGVTGQGWFVYNNASLGWIIALMQKYQTVAKHIPEECPYRKVICEYCSQQI
jgi:hypothetical protein